MDNEYILDMIDHMVKPLNPPVETFEKSARRSPFRILISVLLSARTRDTVTYQASEKLFAAADSPQAMTRLDEKEIAALIYPAGFYQQKAKHIKEIATILSQTDRYSETGGIPSTFDDLTALPGVGRKTANLVLSLALGKPSIAVDTHVFRISHRLGWATGKTPEKTEEELKQAFPPESWNRINRLLVGFGQTLCKPIHPMCHVCDITAHCLYFKAMQEKTEKKIKKSKEKTTK
ncbi:MAG: endonuclease III domain-containing protein [Candidatus Omnitrophota bacterium]